MIRLFYFFLVFSGLLIISFIEHPINHSGNEFEDRIRPDPRQTSETIIVDKDVLLGDYFDWLDSLVIEADKSVSHPINEYTLVHANSWIIDSLRHTDYYFLKEKGIISTNSKSIVVVKKGQKIKVPGALETSVIKSKLHNTYLDLNIPEFRLRIIQYGQEIKNFPVRVGQNNRRYLAMAGASVDLRTRVGIGQIVRVNKKPVFINPKNNQRYHVTRRDDGTVTDLPVIPWLEPELDGVRYGQLLHPTTNLETLNKASSNGCVGLRESDAWSLYYYTPLGTRVIFRYQLQDFDDEGNPVEFEDIYPDYEQNLKSQIISTARMKTTDGQDLCDCRTVDNNF